MDTSDDAKPEVGLPQGRFEGRVEFQKLVRDALTQAAQEGWREIILCDASFEDWPLGERAVADALQDWSAAGRKFTILAWRYDDLLHRHARFVTWRKAWSHIIEARGCHSADPLAVPSGLWSPHWFLHRLDPVRSEGTMGQDPHRRVAMRELLQEWLSKSSPAFPASTLGL